MLPPPLLPQHPMQPPQQLPQPLMHPHPVRANVPPAQHPVVEADVPCHTLHLQVMNLKCSDCDAWHWREECLTSSTNTRLKFRVCCISGNIQLSKLKESFQPLRNLLKSQYHKGKTFRENICQYNAALAFTSLGAKLDHSVMGNGGGPYVFRIHGEKYGPLYAFITMTTNAKWPEVMDALLSGQTPYLVT